MSARLSRALLRALAAAAAVVAITLLVRWWPFVVTGTVRLESFDRSVSAPYAATACVVPRRQLLAHIRKEFGQLPARTVAAQGAIGEARERWNRKARRRDDALKVLRVAERSNASDLLACRAAYERAASEADESYSVMEKCTVERDALEDPSTILAGLPAASSAQTLDAGGRFALHSWGPRSSLFVLVSAQDNDGSSMLWLAPADRAPEVYDNSNILTADALRALAGLK